MHPLTAVCMFVWEIGMPVVLAHHRMTPERFDAYLWTYFHLVAVVAPVMCYIVWKLVECRREAKQ